MQVNETSDEGHSNSNLLSGINENERRTQPIEELQMEKVKGRFQAGHGHGHGGEFERNRKD